MEGEIMYPNAISCFRHLGNRRNLMKDCFDHYKLEEKNLIQLGLPSFNGSKIVMNKKSVITAMMGRMERFSHLS